MEHYNTPYITHSDSDEHITSNQQSTHETPSSFEAFGLTKPCLQALTDLGFTTPTPIQSAVIPAALEHHDILAAAQTGTGKTLSFLLPIFDLMVRHWGSKRPKRAKGPYVLILAPTRELATQIATQARILGKATQFRVLNVIGGKKYKTQIEALKRGCDVLIATPGRLQDLLDQKACSLSHVHYLVIDEVDRMMDMGFWPSVLALTKQVTSNHQTYLLSATLSDEITAKAAGLQHDAERIEVSHKGETADSVDEFIMPVAQTQKTDLILALLKEKGCERVLIFTHTKTDADALAARLQKEQYRAQSIHSDKPQKKRDQALRNFSQGTCDILVATDVLARGIDVDEVSYVVNLSVPKTPQDYVHRIGRTGRAGKQGGAYTFFTPDQLLDLREIEYFTASRIPIYDVPGFAYDETHRLIPDPKRPTKRSARKSNTLRRLRFGRR